MQLTIDKISLEELVRESANGHHKSQMTLYDRYYKMVFNSSYRILHNKVEAEDVMQEAFIDAFSNLSKLDEPEKFGAWIKRIVINKSINEVKKRSYFETDVSKLKDHSEETESELDNQMEVEKIYRCINELSDGYRVISTLYLLEGYDHDEISGVLNITSSTSRSQLTRAKIKIRELYHEKYGQRNAR